MIVDPVAAPKAFGVASFAPKNGDGHKLES